MAGVRSHRGRQTGATARAGRAGLLPDRGPGHRYRPRPAITVPKDRRQPHRAAGLRRRLAVPGGRAAARRSPPVPGVQGVRRAQRRPGPVPVAGRHAAGRRARSRRQRGADTVGRGHTGPRRVHRRNRQPGHRLRGETVS